MTRITIKTTAYAYNRHFQEIAAALREAGFPGMTNVAIDGQVSLDTKAPKELVALIVANRPKSVSVHHYA